MLRWLDVMEADSGTGAQGPCSALATGCKKTSEAEPVRCVTWTHCSDDAQTQHRMACRALLSSFKGITTCLFDYSELQAKTME